MKLRCFYAIMNIFDSLVITYMPFLLKLFAVPVFKNDEQSRVGKLLHWTLIAVIFIVVLDCIVLAIFAPETIPTFWINYLAIAFSFACLVMLHRGWVLFTSALFCAVIWLLTVYYLATSGGVTSPAFGFLSVGIIMATVLLGTRGALAFGLITIATAVLLFIAGENGWIINQEAAPTAARLFGTQTTIFVALTLFMTSSSKSLLGALKRSRQSEQELAKQNLVLQEEIGKRQRIENEQKRLITVIEANPALIGVAAANGQIIFINKAGRKLLGLDESINLREANPEGLKKNVFRELPETALTDGVWEGESRLLAKDGREIPTSQVILVHHDAKGKFEYFSTIIHDISEQKEAEAHRLELALQQERLKSFKEFLSHISHDLKTPMTVIRTSFHLLERQTDPEKRQKKIESIGQQLRLLEKYIQDLLDLSRLDHLPSLNISRLNLNDLLQSLANRLHPLAEEAGISFELKSSEALPSISADAFEFERALVNLIENAIHYTPRGGKVTLSGRIQNSNIIIEVQDTGIGIKAEEKDAIFERFFRSEEARNLRPAGTGLGLAIVKRIVEIHGGSINLESDLGKGSSFIVSIPRQSVEAKVS
jgi:PAS domain S-box-containing protein